MSLLTFKAHRSKIQMAKNFHSHKHRRAAENHLQIPLSNTKFGMIWNDLPNEYLMNIYHYYYYYHCQA